MVFFNQDLKNSFKAKHGDTLNIKNWQKRVVNLVKNKHQFPQLKILHLYKKKWSVFTV